MHGSWKRGWPWVLCLLLLIALIASLSPVQIQYHKLRLQSAKARKTRLLAQNPSPLDKFWLFLGSPVAGQELDAAIRRHEDALVDLRFLFRAEYYPRRGTVPTRANSAFAAIIEKMDVACPSCSYRVSKSKDSLTATATKKCLELWKSIAPNAGLQPNKPSPDDRRCGGKRSRRSRPRVQPDNPVSFDWAGVLGRPATSSR